MQATTIQLPEELSERVYARGISQEALQVAVTTFVQAMLDEEDPTVPHQWSDAKVFAERFINNNRALFEELAHL